MLDPKQRYGDIGEAEADLFDRLLGTIHDQFDGNVSFLEIGILSGNTTRGVVRRCKELGSNLRAVGVDIPQWNPNPKPECDYTFYGGDSMDQFRNIKDNFNFLFIDGCHCVVHSSQDFLNYSPLVVVGGFCLFHDTALPLNQYEQMDFPQDHSFAGKDPGKLGVREGLKKLGLLQNYRADWKFIEEVPNDSGMMGLMLYQRVLPY